MCDEHKKSLEFKILQVLSTEEGNMEGESILFQQDYPKSTEWFIEDQALSPSYDFVSPPHTPPVAIQQVVSPFQSSCVSPRSSLMTGRGKGVGEELNHTMARKPGPL